MKTEQREVKFPENLIYKKKLQTGDYDEIGKLCEHTSRYMGEVFNGRSKMTDNMKRAYIKHLENREKLNREVTEKAKVKQKTKSKSPLKELTEDSPEQCRDCKGGPECSCGEPFCPYF